MRINNVSSKTSVQNIVLCSTILLVYLIAYTTICIFLNPAELLQSYQNIEDWYDKFWLGIFFFVVPALFAISLVWGLFDRKRALESLNIGLNLKYVDFLQERVNFKFTQPQYDFTCGYDDIENVEMNLITQEVHNKGNTFIVLREIELTFKVLNGKKFSLYNTPLNQKNFIYKVIDYTRPKLAYKFSGAGINSDLKERIDDYMKKGCKQVLSTEQEDKFKFLSLVFFVMAMVIVCSFIGEIEESVQKGDYGILFMFTPFLIFMIIPIILDIFLIRDKINDKKFHTEHKSKELIGKIPCETIITVQVISLLVVAFMCFKPLILGASDNAILKNQNNNEFKELWINPPSEFNNLRKDEIYSIRKAYVKDSLFASNNYEPNEKVFGQIQDYKPWWGEQKCRPLNYTGDYHESIEGESKQSIQINNPNALVGLSSPYIPWDVEGTADFCNSEYSRFIPQRIKYSKKDNLIVAEYEVSKEFPNIYVNISDKWYRYPIQLSGLNALDFGYKYVYAFDTKNIDMTYPDNITQIPEMFRDFLHVGGSCGYEGGCNNISPMQNDKMISVKALPAEINLKLWKKQPRDKYSKADMYYRIIFKEQ